MSFGSLSEYADLANNAFGEQQGAFARKAQEESAKEENEQSMINKIQGATLPFAVEATKRGAIGLGGKVLNRLGVKGGEGLVKDLISNPNKAMSTLVNKASTSITEAGNDIVTQGLQNIKNRVTNAGVSPSDPNSVEPTIPEDDDEPIQVPQKNFANYDDIASDLKNEDNSFLLKNFTQDFNVSKSSPLIQPKATPDSSNSLSPGESDPFKSLSGYDDIVNDIASGKRSVLDGVIHAQVRGDASGKLPLLGDDDAPLAGKNISPKILDLQKQTNLRVGDIPNQASDGELQGMVARALPPPPPPPQPDTPQAPPIASNDQPPPKFNSPDTPSNQATPNSTLQDTNVADDIQNGAGNEANKIDTDLTKSLTDDAEDAVTKTAEEGVSSVTSGLKTALIANTGDLENPIGDVVEAGLGIATLFSSLFGSSVNHAAVQAPKLVSSAVGFGIKQQ